MPPRPECPLEGTGPAEPPLWAEHGWALSARHAVALVALVAVASALVNAFGGGLIRLAGLD